MAKDETKLKKTASGKTPSGKSKPAPRARTAGETGSDLHYVLISKDGTVTVVSRGTGEAKTLKGADAAAFADLVSQRQALGRQLGERLVERGFNGGSWELCLFIESYK